MQVIKSVCNKTGVTKECQHLKKSSFKLLNFFSSFQNQMWNGNKNQSYNKVKN